MTTRERHLAVRRGQAPSACWPRLHRLSVRRGPVHREGQADQARERRSRTRAGNLKRSSWRRRSSRPPGSRACPATSACRGRSTATCSKRCFRRADFAPGTSRSRWPSRTASRSPIIAPRSRPTQSSPTTDAQGRTLPPGRLHADVLPAAAVAPDQEDEHPAAVRRRDSAARTNWTSTMTIEALVLDNAPQRPTLLPVIREMALLSGPAAHTGLQHGRGRSGHGSPIPPAGRAGRSGREYLAVAGKNIFFGPLPPPPRSTDNAAGRRSFSVHCPDVDCRLRGRHGSLPSSATSWTTTTTRSLRAPTGRSRSGGEYELNGKKTAIAGIQ